MFTKLPEFQQKALLSRAIWAFTANIILLFGVLFIGCADTVPSQDPLDQVEPTISTFEEIEAEIHRIESTTRERDARERVYFHFFAERDALLEIAQGDYNPNSSLHRALIQEMSWVTLGELLERRPDFELRALRERNVTPAPEPAPAEVSEGVEQLPEEFQ